MNRHPGGAEHTRRLLELGALPAGSSIADFGAGDGSAAELMNGMGYRARGIDLRPGSPAVEQGDFLHSGLPGGSLDGVLAECSFFVSGDVPGAIAESARVLRNGGVLMLSDVAYEAPDRYLETEGFEILHREDLTELWREYYIEALWRGDAECTVTGRGKCRYLVYIARKR